METSELRNADCGLRNGELAARPDSDSAIRIPHSALVTRILYGCAGTGDDGHDEEMPREATMTPADRRSRDTDDELLYVTRVRTVAAPAPVAHAIYGRVFEPEIIPLPPADVAAGLGSGEVRVRALDQLVAALAG
jgi:hypothetical protein